MKHKIKQWISTGCPFAEGVRLFSDHGYNDHFLAILRNQGESKLNRQLLEYQLCKKAGIGEQEKRVLLSGRSIVTEKTELPKPNKISKKESSEQKRIRKRYTFLEEASCPDEFKILVADGISAYHRYIGAHKKLFNVVNEKECYLAATEVVENYLENRKIHQELMYYKQHKKILGRHKIFAQQKRKKELRNMNIRDLIKLEDKLKHRIWRNQNKMKRQPKSKNNFSRIKRIENFNKELHEIKLLLND